MEIPIVAFLITLFFLARSVMIILGRLKGPILQGFEKYGDDEQPYQPMVSVMAWGGATLLTTSELLGSSFCIVPLVFLIWAVAYLMYVSPEKANHFPALFFRYPRWLYELLEYTSRYERRRLAYMWLRLPRRTRAAYNSDDNAFREWADLVILANFSY